MGKRIYEGDELFNSILSKMDYVENSNNYVQNTLIVEVFCDGVQAETACTNDFNSLWGNEDRQFIPRDEFSPKEWECILNI